MVLCVVALVVFAVLGIFSARYRAYAGEAFDCVRRTAMLRPCDTGFDTKIKTKLSSTLSKVHFGLGRFVFKHFVVLSWVFVLLFFASLGYSVVSVYNFLAFGNCNGPESTLFCPLNAVTGRPELGKPLNLEGIVLGDPKSPNVLVEYGCFTCPYSKAAEHGLSMFLEKHRDVFYVLKPFPLPSHRHSFEAAQAAYCADEQGKFSEYRLLLFNNQDAVKANGSRVLKEIAKNSSLNFAVFSECLDSNRTAEKVRALEAEGRKVGIYGTPTFFYNNRSAVGPLTAENFDKFAAGQYFEPMKSLDEGVCPHPSAAR